MVGVGAEDDQDDGLKRFKDCGSHGLVLAGLQCWAAGRMELRAARH